LDADVHIKNLFVHLPKFQVEGENRTSGRLVEHY